MLTEEGEDETDNEEEEDDDLDEDGSLILGRTSSIISRAYAALPTTTMKPQHVGAAVGAAVTPREQQVFAQAAAIMEESK